MKRRLCILAAVLLAGNAAVLSANPSFTVGSNPYRTISAFPHQLELLPVQGILLQFAFLPRPWMGNISDPAARPNDSYTSDYQSVQFALPDDYTGDPDAADSHALFKGSYNQYQGSIGVLLFRKAFRVLAEAGGTYHDMSMSASGTARGYSLDPDDATKRIYSVVPFDADSTNTQFTAFGRLTASSRFSGIPVGFRLEEEYLFPNRVRGHFDYTKDGVETETPLLTWGWSTNGCSNIFGFDHRESVIDSFYLDSYDIASGWKTNLQASFALSGMEFGARARFTNLEGSTYWRKVEKADYETAEGATLKKDFALYRAYAKIPLVKFGPNTMGVLGFLEYDAGKTADVAKDSDSDFIPYAWSSDSGIVVEANPYFNFVLSPKSTLDIGILVEGDFQDRDNLRWSGNSVGLDEVFQDSVGDWNPIPGFSTWWERYSERSTNAFVTGFEASSSLSLTGSIALVSSTLTMLKLTWEEKRYGLNEPADSETVFKDYFRRNDWKRELWMTGSIGVSMRIAGMVHTLSADLPLAYLAYLTTRLSDLEADKVVFDNEKSNVFQVQEPFKVRYSLMFAPAGPGGMKPGAAVKTSKPAATLPVKK